MFRLGVIGGTFDPPHLAHMVMAEQARVRFELDTVLFIPTGTPPHKVGYPISHAEHRYAMVVLATSDNDAFQVSRIEIDREGPSYSVDTIRRLKAEYPSDTGMYFIVGADEAYELPNWHDAGSLPGLARFIAAPRPGFDISKLEEQLPAEFSKVVDILDAPMIGTSATNVRARAAAGESIRYLVPDSVEAYIRKHGLYVEGGR